MKYLILIIALANLTNTFGQGHYNLPPEKTYERAIVGMKNFQKKKVRALSISSDSVGFRENNRFYVYHLDEINYIRVQEGTKAKNGALVGGASTLLISLGSILRVQSTPGYELNGNAGGLTVLFTLGGAAIGGLIGSAIRRETSYYVHMSGQ